MAQQGHTRRHRVAAVRRHGGMHGVLHRLQPHRIVIRRIAHPHHLHPRLILPRQGGTNHLFAFGHGKRIFKTARLVHGTCHHNQAARLLQACLQ